MKKKIALLISAVTAFSMVSGITVCADETIQYSLDELMEMSLEELELQPRFTGIADSIAHIKSNPPIYLENRQCVDYYVLLNNYENVIPTLWETIEVKDADGNMIDLEVKSKAKAAEVLGLPEKVLSDVDILHIGLEDFGSEVIQPFELEQADILYITLDLKAYGEDNIYKTYFLVDALLADNENIKNYLVNGKLGGFGEHGTDITEIVNYGDTNCDEAVDVSDAVLLARFLAEDSEAIMTDQGKVNADANRDDDLSSADVIAILRKIAKLD